MKLKSIFLSLLITFSGIILADFNDGLEAYNQGDYDTAFEEWLPYAEQGDADAQYNLALVYDFGYDDPDEAFKWYKKSAKQGRKGAQYNLALMYEKGKGVLKDYKQAAKWYRKAADQDHAKAQYNLALIYRNGKGVLKDYKQAVKWYRKAADQDHAKAQNNLALLYEYGFGVEKNYKQSIKWYLLAIENKDSEKARDNLKELLLNMSNDVSPVYNDVVDDFDNELYDEAFPKFLLLALNGDANSQTYVGWMYGDGLSVEKDYDKSVKWYRKAAKQEESWGQNNLGWSYHTGNGVPKDYKEAVKWYKKSANQGNDAAQYNLGLMYEQGKGVIENLDIAIEWYRKSADQGYSDSKNKLKKLLALQGLEVMPTLKEARKDYDAEKYESAFPKFLKLAIGGNAKAQAYVGWMYGEGLGIERNYTKSVKWYRKGAKRGDTWSQTNLGWSYHTGNGVSKNYKEAVKWYRKAADKGDEIAQYNMGLMYQKGKGVSQDIDTAIEWFRKSANQGDKKAKSRLKKLLALQGGKSNSQYTVFSGSGTGFLVSKNGVFATNHHVIDGCGRIVVDEKDAKLVLQDKVNDLALIKINKKYDKVARLSYRSPALGSDISVFGFPLSDMMSEKHISLTKGSVSSLAGMDGNLSNFRFTAPVQPGNSGGPIVNKDGKVVGITRAVLGKTALEKGDFLPQNVNFGIRSSLLINMMESKMIHVNDTPLKVEDIVKHYVKTTKYIKCYE